MRDVNVHDNGFDVVWKVQGGVVPGAGIDPYGNRRRDVWIDP